MYAGVRSREQEVLIYGCRGVVGLALYPGWVGVGPVWGVRNCEKRKVLLAASRQKKQLGPQNLRITHVRHKITASHQRANRVLSTRSAVIALPFEYSWHGEHRGLSRPKHLPPQVQVALSTPDLTRSLTCYCYRKSSTQPEK